jgi:hypothetical protein
MPGTARDIAFSQLAVKGLTPQVNKKESLGQTSQSLQFSLSSRKNATLALSLNAALFAI